MWVQAGRFHFCNGPGRTIASGREPAEATWRLFEQLCSSGTNISDWVPSRVVQTVKIAGFIKKIIRPAPLPLSVNGGGGGQTGSFVLPLCRIYRFRVRQAGAFALSSREILEFSNIKHTGLFSPESLPVSLEIKE